MGLLEVTASNVEHVGQGWVLIKQGKTVPLVLQVCWPAMGVGATTHWHAQDPGWVEDRAWLGYHTYHVI